MSGVRSTGFVVSLALLASLVGHIAIQKYFERRWQDQLLQGQVEFNFNLSPNGQALDEIYSAIPPLTGIAPGKVIPLSGIIPVSDVQDDGNKHQPAPTAVPVPADAVPVESATNEQSPSRDENTAQVREVIEHELASSTSEERDIWFEELKSLPAGVVADLLQVRRQLHSLPKLMGGMPDKLASADASVVPRVPETTAEPVSQRIHFNSYDQHSSTEAIESAISQLRHNIVNAATPGYKRLRVTLVDTYSPRSTDKSEDGGLDDRQVLGEGCRLGPVLIEIKPGAPKMTGRTFDLAIEGNGFFVVSKNGKQYLTRCGKFSLDREFQLCLATTSEPAVLQPAIKLPHDTDRVEITAEGLVKATQIGTGDVTEIGRIQLATVIGFERLQPVGEMLLVETEASGPAVMGEPGSNGLGVLHQFFLESSNVDIEAELAEIEELSNVLKAIPQPSSRPATARNPQQNLSR